MKKTLNLLKLLFIAIFSRLAFLPLCLLPIRKNRVLFECFRGKQYACNPKYISEKLVERYGDQLEIAWSFRNPEEFAFLKKSGVRVIKNQSFAFYYYALTARVVCLNTYYKPTLPRRRGQFFLRTWHGGGAYKRVGKMAKMPPLERLYVGMQQSGANLYLSSSRAFTILTVRDSFGYKGEVLECGMPRNDILLRVGTGELRARTRDALGLEPGERLVLYAPTYRENAAPNAFHIDYSRMAAALGARFGGKWRCAYRGHHTIMYKNQGDSAKGAADLTLYPDIQELLLVADALVTDYSSTMWDMSLTGKPVFLYATDVREYETERDFYTDIHAWPFPLAENNDELEQNILRFNEKKYAQDVARHHDRLGNCETGLASDITARRIYKACMGGKK